MPLFSNAKRPKGSAHIATYILINEINVSCHVTHYPLIVRFNDGRFGFAFKLIL